MSPVLLRTSLASLKSINAFSSAVSGYLHQRGTDVLVSLAISSSNCSRRFCGGRPFSLGLYRLRYRVRSIVGRSRWVVRSLIYLL